MKTRFDTGKRQLGNGLCNVEVKLVNTRKHTLKLKRWSEENETELSGRW